MIKRNPPSRRGIREKGETALQKYKRYLANINWHIKTNHPSELELEKLEVQIGIYKQIIHDIETIIYF